MKIVSIFGEKLYACQYNGEENNEYTRLMNSWRDVVYLRQFASQNYISDKWNFISEIQEDAEYIQDLMVNIAASNRPLESFFKPLNNLETGERVLSLQKGRRYKLRIYAIKIDENLFLITGGAIKLVLKMQDHADTRREKVKLEATKTYLKLNGVFNNDSFYELINENYED